ncbi:hypothetical protein T10_5740 [Trichinella papuae]|uniref:Uncharacterized protein n=1 Tax=Trichinella papuae TaxID=268474 RepID=A0A0V1N606_9BILA|nr:hypothetical protein T10_5740 [Trichinella papuae]
MKIFNEPDIACSDSSYNVLVLILDQKMNNLQKLQQHVIELASHVDQLHEILMVFQFYAAALITLQKCRLKHSF